MSSSVLPILSSKSFKVSGLTFDHLVFHFEFIFVNGLRRCSNFVLFYITTVSPAPLIEEAERSYPTPPSPRPGAAASRTNPTSKEPWLFGRRRA